MHFDETLKLMKILKDHGVDMFNVSAGLHSEGLFKYIRYWLQGYTMQRGFNAHWTQKIKDHFQGDIRLTAVGSITSVDLAEEYLSKGWCDFVAMCRPLMADPDMPRKAAANQREDIRPLPALQRLRHAPRRSEGHQLCHQSHLRHDELPARRRGACGKDKEKGRRGRCRTCRLAGYVHAQSSGATT